MARLYSNENLPNQVVRELRRLGHDVLTSADAGRMPKFSHSQLPRGESFCLTIAAIFLSTELKITRE